MCREHHVSHGIGDRPSFVRVVAIAIDQRRDVRRGLKFSECLAKGNVFGEVRDALSHLDRKHAGESERRGLRVKSQTDRRD